MYPFGTFAFRAATFLVLNGQVCPVATIPHSEELGDSLHSVSINAIGATRTLTFFYYSLDLSLEPQILGSTWVPQRHFKCEASEKNLSVSGTTLMPPFLSKPISDPSPNAVGSTLNTDPESEPCCLPFSTTLSAFQPSISGSVQQSPASSPCFHPQPSVHPPPWARGSF